MSGLFNDDTLSLYLKLKEAMKRHLYKIKYGETAMQNAQSTMNNYDPLAI